MGSKPLPSPATNDSALDTELYASWYADPILMFRQALPHWFPEPMPWVHRGITAIMLRQTDFLLNFGKELWDEAEYEWTIADLEKLVRNFTTPLDPNQPEGPQREIFTIRYDMAGRAIAVDLELRQHAVIVMPRGFSKTTTINACNLYEIVFQLVPFLVYLSKAESHAADQMATILRELRGNALILGVFGNIVPSKQDKEKSTSIDMEFLNGTYLTVRGSNAQIRGMNKGAVRPHHIVFDDVETKASAESPEQTAKMKKWAYSDVMFAFPRKRGTGRATALGTLLGPETLLASLLKNKRFTQVRFGALDRDGEALWDFAMTKEDIVDEELHAAEQGMTREFNLEIMSKTIVTTDRKFPDEFLYRAYQWDEFVARAIMIDPAISEKKDSDLCSLAVVGLTDKGRLHVCDFMMSQLNPRQQIDHYFRLHFLWRCTHHGVEAVAYQKALQFLISEEQGRFSKHFGASAFFSIDAVFHGKTNKVTRVEGGLSTRYLAGYVTHQRCFPDLEAQLKAWPIGKKDGPDVVAMASNLLAPLAGFSIDDTDGKLLSDQSYEPLDSDYFAMVP